MNLEGDIRIAAVGDLLLGDSPICVGFGLRSRYPGRALATALAPISPLLRAADIGFGNLECTLSETGLRPRNWRSVQLRGMPEYASVLNDAGFSILSVTNNHATQHGDETFRQTVEILRDQGVAVCGVRGEGGWSCRPEVISVRGRDVGVLAYNLRPRQYSLHEPPYAEGEAAAIIADVRRLRSTVDRLVVSMHWGEEFVGMPSRSEVDLGHRIVDAGADLLLGHHPHVARPVERFGDGLIAYSLGNAVADMVWQPSLRRGLLLDAVLGGDEYRVIPLEIDDSFTPRLASLDAAWGALSPDGVGLPEGEYSTAVRATVNSQRAAAYRYAAARIHRFPPRVLAQLAMTTIRNKVAAVTARR
jgi:gamma-polyglutamate biosynthesis protein CapA